MAIATLSLKHGYPAQTLLKANPPPPATGRPPARALGSEPRWVPARQACLQGGGPREGHGGTQPLAGMAETSFRGASVGWHPRPFRLDQAGEQERPPTLTPPSPRPSGSLDLGTTPHPSTHLPPQGGWTKLQPWGGGGQPSQAPTPAMAPWEPRCPPPPATLSRLKTT